MKFGPFLGINNLLRADELTVYEKGKPAGQYLRHAVNVDLDNAGRLSRRAGTTLAEAMTGAHSLWSERARTLFCRDSGLYEITDFAPYAETLLTSLASDAPMSFDDFVGHIYFSNGTDSGRLLKGEEYPEPWSLAVPAAPIVSETTGTLAAGSYLLSITFANAHGEEGGASPVQSVALASGGGITVTIPSAAPGASLVNIYLSAPDGGALTRNATVAAGSGTAVVDSPSIGHALSQQHMAPQPAGQLVAIHHARLLVASGALLTYSNPRTPGKYLPSKGFIQFLERITNLVPCSGGVYVTTTERTYWLAGPDIAAATMRPILPYGAAEGSRFRSTSDQTVGWYGDAGVVIADEAGTAKAIQEDRMATDTADYAAVLPRDAGGVVGLVVALRGNIETPVLAQPGIAEETAGILHGL